MLKLPAHKGALTIEHNDHKSCYETVASMMDARNARPDECGSVAEYTALREGDEIWQIQWYPHTPVGFHRVFASTLERALELANAEDHD